MQRELHTNVKLEQGCKLNETSEEDSAYERNRHLHSKIDMWVSDVWHVLYCAN